MSFDTYYNVKIISEKLIKSFEFENALFWTPLATLNNVSTGNFLIFEAFHKKSKNSK